MYYLNQREYIVTVIVCVGGLSDVVYTHEAEHKLSLQGNLFFQHRSVIQNEANDLLGSVVLVGLCTGYEFACIV